MKRKIITVVIILVCFLLQATVLHSIALAEVKPNLLVIVTASFGFMRGKRPGMYVGIICGVLADICWGNVIGFYTLLFAVIGYVNGCFQRLFYDEDIKLPIALIAASELAYGIILYVCFYMLQGDFAFGGYLTQIILPELVYTILATLILYQVILHINRRLEAEEQRSASKFV